MVIQGRLNSVMLHALWTFAPIFISIISFFTYVMLGNQLTIGVAFTVYSTPSFVMSQFLHDFFKQAIALFNMIRSISLDLCLKKTANTPSRAPLNVIPSWIVQILQVHPFTYFMFDSE